MPDFATSPSIDMDKVDLGGDLLETERMGNRHAVPPSVETQLEVR